MNTDEISETMLLESEVKYLSDVRDFIKYLITLAVTIVPVIIGITGLLLNNNELNGFAIGFLSTGLASIFISITINIFMYRPTNNPYRPGSNQLIQKTAFKKSDWTYYSTLPLVLGILLSFIGILLILFL